MASLLRDRSAAEDVTEQAFERAYRKRWTFDAHVASRTDNTNDITTQFDSASGQLAKARALRTSLLKRLQQAVTDAQIAA